MNELRSMWIFINLVGIILCFFIMYFSLTYPDNINFFNTIKLLYNKILLLKIIKDKLYFPSNFFLNFLKSFHLRVCAAKILKI